MSALGLDDSGGFVLGAAYVPGSGFPVRRRLEVVDLTTGASEIVSIDRSGSQLDSEIGVISSDGRYVAFVARAAGDQYAQVYLRDREAGTTDLVSARNGIAGGGHSRPVAISADAGRVLFSTAATDLAGGCGAGCDSLVVWTRATGQLTLVSIVGGIAVDGEYGDLSADGSHVAVQLRGPSQACDQIYVRNLATGEVVLASATPAGLPGNQISASPRLDGTGSTVVFQTAADDLIADDRNDRADIAVRDIASRSTRLLAPLAGSSGAVDISTNGTTVVASLSREPISGEPHGAPQVYAIDVENGSYRLVSRATRTGLPGAAESILPPRAGLLSANGQCVVFSSLADELVPGDVFDMDGTVTNGLGRSFDTFVDAASSCVPPDNSAPVAVDTTLAGDEDSSVAVDLVANDADGDALTFSVVDSPAHGTLRGTAPALTYTPDANWHGTDTLMFTAADLTEGSAPATITIEVRPVNDLPTVSIVTPSPGTRLAVGSSVALDTAVADVADGNGPITCQVTWGDGSIGSSCDDAHVYTVAGTFTIRVTASDVDGGRAVATTSVTVEPVITACRFEGFFQPVDNAPIVNRVTAGSNVPVKFRYCTDGRLRIFAAASPSSSAHACGTASTDAIEETMQPGPRR